MKMYYVYLYSDPSNSDEVFYVGKASSEYRTRYHLTRKDKHPLTEKIQGMSIKPTITKIECSTEEIALTLEENLINLIGRKADGGTLLNLAKGGIRGGGSLNKGKPKSPETRAKMRDAKIGVPKSLEHRKNNPIYQKGRVISPETRAKMKAAKSNITEEFRQKMSSINKGRIPWNKGLKKVSHV